MMNEMTMADRTARKSMAEARYQGRLMDCVLSKM